MRPNRIYLNGDGFHEEALANAAITPGNLVELMSTGKVRNHAEGGGIAERAFAEEDALQGRDIDTDYAANEVVSFVLAEPGDTVLAWLHGGEVAVIGSKLASAGDGTLLVIGSSEIVQPLAVAIEAVDASDSGAVKNRIRVRII